MIHLTDRRCTSCIHYASDILWERTGWRLPVPEIEEGADNEKNYIRQMEKERVNLRPISEMEDNAIILYQGVSGYHVGVYIKELDRVVHGAARKKSTATKVSDMNRLYNQVQIYRLQGGSPGKIDPNFHTAEFFDPFTAIITGIVMLGASVLIKNYLDRGNRDLPEREPQNTFNLVGGQNQTRPDEALPWTAGRIRAYPDFSIPPYNRYVGQTNDQGDRNSPIQEWRAGVNWGVGRLRLEQLRLGDTDFLQFLAFDSPNSFDVVGNENERPAYWDQNVGGARGRTETFSVFTELDYRDPGFIQFTTGGGSGAPGQTGSELLGPTGGGAGITDLGIPGAEQAAIEDIESFLDEADKLGVSPFEAFSIINETFLSPDTGLTLLERNTILGRAITGALGGDPGDPGRDPDSGRGGDIGGRGGEFGSGNLEEGRLGGGEGPGPGGGGGDN